MSEALAQSRFTAACHVITSGMSVPGMRAYLRTVGSAYSDDSDDLMMYAAFTGHALGVLARLAGAVEVGAYLPVTGLTGPPSTITRHEYHRATVRYCSACGDEVTHITQCEKDGHRAHHAGCCPDRHRP